MQVADNLAVVVCRRVMLAFCACCIRSIIQQEGTGSLSKQGLVEKPLLSAVFEVVARRTACPVTCTNWLSV